MMYLEKEVSGWALIIHIFLMARGKKLRSQVPEAKPAISQTHIILISLT